MLLLCISFAHGWSQSVCNSKSEDAVTADEMGEKIKSMAPGQNPLHHVIHLPSHLEYWLGAQVEGSCFMKQGQVLGKGGAIDFETI